MQSSHMHEQRVLDPREAQQRAVRHWFEDGLAELAMGVVLLLVGGLFWWDAAVSQGAATSGVSAVGLPVVVLVGMIGSQWVVRRLKERYSYPMAGFVEYVRPRGRRRWGGALVAVVLSAVLALWAVGATAPWAAGVGGGIAGAFWIIGRRTGLSRFHVLALVAVGGGVLASILDRAGGWGLAGLLTLVGGALVVVGVVEFRRFRRAALESSDE